MTKSIKITGISAVVILIVLMILAQGNLISAKIANSLIFAVVLNLLNFLIAVYSINYSFKKSNAVFMMAVFGGMGLRLILMLALLLITILFLNIDKYAFIFGFFIIYFVFLIYEIYLIRHKAVERKN